MHRKLMALAAAVSMVLLVSGVAAADTVTTNFEAFQLGTVNGQDGWKSSLPGQPSCPPGAAYDQMVVTNSDYYTGGVAGFGQQSLRMSNLFPCREFNHQTYSSPVTAPAGEELANTEYTAQFSFITTRPAAQPGLVLTVSPDSYEGSRMSWVGLEDTAGGTQVTVSDSPNVDGEFVDYGGPLLPRGVPHTIKFWIKTKPGLDNDLVRIYVDGKDLGQCFTTWENYYRTSPEQAPPPNENTPATINSLQFRSSVPGFTGTNGGYLFDNVTVTTANGSGPPGCDTPIEKTADSPTVRAGGQAGYQITVRNRGRLAARNLRVCDHIPRRTTFVSADRKLRRIGRQRCLMIPSLRPGQRSGFHVVLQVNADAPPGMLANIADIIQGTPGLPPAGEPGSPPAPGAGRPPSRIARIKAIVRARATVRILKRVQAQRGRPPFTG